MSSTPSDELSSPIVSWQVDWHDGPWGGIGHGDGGGRFGLVDGHVFADGYQGGNVSVTAIDGEGNSFVLPDRMISITPECRTICRPVCSAATRLT